jgi:formylglycine-generating enzyme required for sulfatase activity
MPTYWIGKTPVTNAQFRPFVAGISWFEVVAYCRWLVAQTDIPLRLSTEAE